MKLRLRWNRDDLKIDEWINEKNKKKNREQEHGGGGGVGWVGERIGEGKSENKKKFLHINKVGKKKKVLNYAFFLPFFSFLDNYLFVCLFDLSVSIDTWREFHRNNNKTTHLKGEKKKGKIESSINFIAPNLCR